ncbi:MAG: hypothetical protein P8019_00155 [Gammaproteobacteria bacterium]
MNYNNNAKQGGTGLGLKRLATGLILFSGALALSACGGGASNTQNPKGSQTGIVSTSSKVPLYQGPPPASQDTLYFSKYLWNNLRTQNHCASCHDDGGQGGVYFASNSDVNEAYAAVMNSSKPLVDLKNPAKSLMVTKFSQSGHYCLDGTNALCAQELTNWITAWANAESGGGSTTITLTPPAIHAPQAPLNFPSSPDNYGAVYNLVSNHCNGCHVPNPTQSATPVAPEFATSSEADSYSLASTIPLINIADPKQSRFYTRLAVDGHNCWTDCATAASQMLNAIKQFTDPIQAAAKTAPSAADTYLASDAVNLFQDGIVASGGGRYEADQIAMYNFKTGSGNTILDVSGVAPAMNLTLSGTEGVDYKWMSNWGIEFDTKNAKAQALTSDSAKLTNLIATYNAGYSIEAWVAPANTTQTSADIVTYTGGDTVGNNFSLGQNATSYEAYNRDQNDLTGNITPLDVPGLNASLQHVVLTNDPIKGTQLYINGVAQIPDPTNPTPDPRSIGENLGNWISSFAFVLGNDPSRQHSWLGQIRMLAIHSAPLTPQEVLQNYHAGVGQQYFLLFNISSHLGTECNPATGPSCFILMKASVFDNTSYLFSEPRFINLNDPNVSTEPPVLLKGMRIGVNGNDSGNDQVFSRMDVCVNGPCAFSTVDARTRDVSYQKGITPADGALLSSQGAVIAMQNGPRGNGGLAPDMIFLTFDAINDAAKPHTIVSTSSLTSPTPTVHPVVNDNILVHSFEEIDATLAKLTGIPRTDIASTYASVIQSLPSTHDAGSYNSANQMAVTQLAISYCSTMVNNQETADTNGPNNNKFFPNITFNKTNQTITSTSGVNQQGLSFTADDVNDIVQPLISHLMNVEYNGTAAAKTLSFMPVYSQVQSYLADLINGGTINTSAGPITVQGLAPTTVSNNSPAPCGQGTSYCSYARSIQIIKATCTAAVASAPMLLH